MRRGEQDIREAARVKAVFDIQGECYFTTPTLLPFWHFLSWDTQRSGLKGGIKRDERRKRAKEGQ